MVDTHLYADGAPELLYRLVVPDVSAAVAHANTATRITLRDGHGTEHEYTISERHWDAFACWLILTTTSG